MRLGCTRFGSTVLLGMVSFLGVNSGRGAVISAAAQSAVPGQTIVIPIVFAAQGAQVSGLQFDLTWDPGIDVKVAIGDPLRTSSKLLYATGLAPAMARCLLVGMDVNVIPDGEILKLYVIVDPAAQSGTAQVHLTNLSATDPNGNITGVSSSDPGISIQGSTNSSISQGTVLNAASLVSGMIAPGEIITLFDYATPDTTLLVNGIQAPILYAGGNQINAVVPFGLDVSAPATIESQSNGQTIATGTIPTGVVSPAIFTQTGAATGPGAILDQNYSVNSPAMPAAAGSTIMIYGTGFGALQPPVPDGQVPTDVASTVLPVTATIGGISAQVSYAGAVPGLIAVTQINVVVPKGLPTNSPVPVILRIGSVSTQSGVTVFVQ